MITVVLIPVLCVFALVCGVIGVIGSYTWTHNENNIYFRQIG